VHCDFSRKIMLTLESHADSLQNHNVHLLVHGCRALFPHFSYWCFEMIQVSFSSQLMGDCLINVAAPPNKWE